MRRQEPNPLSSLQFPSLSLSLSLHSHSLLIKGAHHFFIISSSEASRVILCFATTYAFLHAATLFLYLRYVQLSITILKETSSFVVFYVHNFMHTGTAKDIPKSRKSPLIAQPCSTRTGIFFIHHN